MIVAIADDLTGAAELGGIALRHRLTAEVQTEFDPSTDVDLTIIDTDTRAGSAEEAVGRLEMVADQCLEAATGQVFKKVDSVLRGHVMVELIALLEAWDRCRALLVPANPSLGRTVTRGQYWIDDQPLHTTGFASDPEYPATTSDVRQMLLARRMHPIRGRLDASEHWAVHVHHPGKAMPERGIIVGEATSNADLATWATSLDSDTLPAGAAEFFGACLRARGFELAEGRPSGSELCLDAACLFVCGSASSYTHSFCQLCEAHGIPVLRMPTDLFRATPESPQLIRTWADATVQALEFHPRAVVAIDRPLCKDPGVPEMLSGHLAELVGQVISRRPLDGLFVEGGATATTLVHRFNWERLRVRQELAPGIVCVQIEGKPRPLLTMKPGSYSWPDRVWRPLRR